VGGVFSLWFQAVHDVTSGEEMRAQKYGLYYCPIHNELWINLSTINWYNPNETTCFGYNGVGTQDFVFIDYIYV